MAGHKHWCYQQPGGTGVACSDPEPISEMSLPRRIAQLVAASRNTESNVTSARESLMFLSKNILLSVAEEAERGSGIARAIQRRFDQAAVSDVEPEALAFYQIATFSTVANVLWLVIGGQSQPTEV